MVKNQMRSQPVIKRGTWKVLVHFMTSRWLQQTLRVLNTNSVIHPARSHDYSNTN